MSKEEEVLAALKETITEGHKLLKDMRAERRTFEKVLNDVRKDTRARIERLIETEVKAGLSEYREAMDRAIANATKAVNKRFDTLADIMMGTDDPNKEPLATLVRKWKAEGN